MVISLYVFLPVYLSSRLNYPQVKTLSLFYLSIIGIILYSLHKSYLRQHQLHLEMDGLYEKVNTIKDDIKHQSNLKIGLTQRIKSYSSLEGILEELNQNPDLEYIADKLVHIVFSLIAEEKGACLLYLVDTQDEMLLKLTKAKKENDALVIKTKEGDILDLWVLRHMQPLFIEDIKKDFRFDLQRFKDAQERQVSSLISVPLITNHRLLGVLRLDNPEEGFYPQDDLRLLATISDFSAVAIENGQLFKKTQDLGLHDELTALFTKGYFMERLKEEYKRSVRQNRAISILMLDIDYFKKYNDTFGHTAGDIVLKTIGKVLPDELRDYGALISRFGGEEFCVILIGVNRHKALNIAQQLRKAIEGISIILRNKETRVTVSIGVSTFADDVRDEDELIMKADKAMYLAKQKGRNQVC